jgi:hypothetical protein
MGQIDPKANLRKRHPLHSTRTIRIVVNAAKLPIMQDAHVSRQPEKPEFAQDRSKFIPLQRGPHGKGVIVQNDVIRAFVKVHDLVKGARGCFRKNEVIRPAAARQRVCPRPADQGIISPLTEQPVRAVATKNAVIAVRCRKPEASTVKFVVTILRTFVAGTEVYSA